MPTYLLQSPDDARQRMVYATALAEVGRKDEALREGAQAQELSPNDPLMLYNVACVYSRLGDTGRAIEALRQAISAGYENFPWLRNDPDLDALRDHADFWGTDGRTPAAHVEHAWTLQVTKAPPALLAEVTPKADPCPLQ